MTSLADALKLNFGIVMTDRHRPGNGYESMMQSAILDPIMPKGLDGHSPNANSGDNEQYAGRGAAMARLKIPPMHNGQKQSRLHHSMSMDGEDHADAYREAHSDVSSTPSTVRGDDDGHTGDDEDVTEDDDAGSDSGDEGDFDPVSCDLTKGCCTGDAKTFPEQQRSSHRSSRARPYCRRQLPLPNNVRNLKRQSHTKSRRRPRITTRGNAHFLYVDSIVHTQLPRSLRRFG